VERKSPVPAQAATPPETAAADTAEAKAAAVTQGDDAQDTHTIQPTQCEAFFAAVSGSEVDISQLGLSDGKSFVGGILGDVPTKKNRRRKAA